MGMAESDDIAAKLDGHDDVVVGAPPKSPWKTPAAASPVTPSDSESWPALADAQQRKKTNRGLDLNSANSPPTQSVIMELCNHPPVLVPSLVEQQKFHGRGDNRSPRKPTYQLKPGPKHHVPKGAAPYTVPLPFYPPTFTPPYHTMVPVPPGYPYPFPSGAFARVDAPAMPSFPPLNGDFQPSFQRPTAINHTFHTQQTMGPGPFIRSTFPAGFVDGAHIPGTPCYLPPVPLGSMGVPCPPYFFRSGMPMPPSPDIALRASIVQQIEYYFSDKNLRNDPYLISLMDNQGWVPLSRIAEFKRIKRMNVDIPFILDALQASETIEVQGEMVRRRNEWPKWIPASVDCKTANLGSTDGKNYNSNENRGECPKGPREVPSSDRCPLDQVHLGKDCANESTCDNTDQNRCEASFTGDICGRSNSSTGIDFYLNNTSNGNELDNVQNCSCISQGADSANSSVDIDKSRMLANTYQNDLSNDFSSKIMLDEVMELEQRTVRSGQSFALERSVEEDVEIMANDQAVELY